MKLICAMIEQQKVNILYRANYNLAARYVEPPHFLLRIDIREVCISTIESRAARAPFHSYNRICFFDSLTHDRA
jgi:hypothetical protein